MRSQMIIGAIALMLASIVGVKDCRADASAARFLKPFVDRANTQAMRIGDYGLEVSIVTNGPNFGVSYTQSPIGNSNVPARLLFHPGKWATAKVGARTIYVYLDAYYSGDAMQFFNDRLWSEPFNPNLDTVPPEHPFSPYATDGLGIRIDAETGVLRWTLQSWGNTTSTVDLHVFNRTLIGALGSTTVTISVREYFELPGP